jgi:hypothetical protein
LRISAILSNMAFISYAYVTDMRPILILHCILLPVNIVRLAQIESDGIGRAEPGPLLWNALPGGWRRRQGVAGFARGWAALWRPRSPGSDQPVCVRPALGSKR